MLTHDKFYSISLLIRFNRHQSHVDSPLSSANANKLLLFSICRHELSFFFKTHCTASGNDCFLYEKLQALRSAMWKINMPNGAVTHCYCYSCQHVLSMKIYDKRSRWCWAWSRRISFIIIFIVLEQNDFEFFLRRICSSSDRPKALVNPSCWSGMFYQWK